MEEIQKENEKILLFISNKYKIDINELITDVLEINPDFIRENKETDYDEGKCSALIKKNKKIIQCSRSIKINGFCKIHNEKNENDELPFGTIDNEVEEIISRVSTQSDINDKPKKIIPYNLKVQRIIINNLEYKINPLNYYLYDFYTNEFIGVYSNDKIITNFK
jgi:hypothetical protein